MKATAFGTKIEFLARGFVFGSEAIWDYSDDACSFFYCFALQFFFFLADEWGDEDALRTDSFFPCILEYDSLFGSISTADYSSGYDWMLQKLEVAVEVHFIFEDSDAVDSAE